MTIGFKIKRARLKAGLTQKQLADLTGLKQEYISYIEKGIVKVPRENTLTKIGRIIKI